MVRLITRAHNHIREFGLRSTVSAGRNMLVRKTFGIWQSMGIHVTPVHYHQPIPDTRELSRKRKSVWRSRETTGIDMNDQVQLKFLKEIFPAYREEYVNFPRKGERCSGCDFYLGNGAFEEVDAEVLYCMVRYFKPSRIIEVGSGFSTLLFIKAIGVNRQREGKEGSLTVIDPYPRKMIRSGLPAFANLICQPVEDMGNELFRQLESGDILFIDSSHVVRVGGDVNYLYLDVLPALKEGVIVHAHDIFLPAEYPERWVLGEHRFWTEQYLLQAFLTYNSAFEVLWAGNYMASRYPQELKSAFPSFREGVTLPGSFWIRKNSGRHEDKRGEASGLHRNSLP